MRSCHATEWWQGITDDGTDMHPTTDGMGAMARKKDDAVQVQLLPLAGGYDVERLV